MSEIESGRTSTAQERNLREWVAVFRVSDPEGRETALRIQKPRLVIGSVESADIRLGGEKVSPIHAVVELTREGRGDGVIEATLFDLASDSGVKLNGQGVVTSSLSEGDVIEIGMHRLVFGWNRLDEVERPATIETGGDRLFKRADEDFSSLLSEEPPEQEIFDHGAEKRPALEIVMSWRGLILDVRHFVSESRVRIGASRRAEFAIPAVLSSDTHQLVTRSGSQFVLNLDPKLKGVVQRSGRLERVESLGDGSVPLDTGVFAKLSAGEVDFYLSQTAAPPRLRAGSDRRRDAFLFRTMTLSLLFTGLFFFSLSRMTVPQQIEAEQLPERIATILYQPEKYAQPRIPQPKPAPEPAPKALPEKPQVTKVDLKPNPENAKKPIPKEIQLGKQAPKPSGRKQSVAQDRAKEGEGARAKGKEGRRGERNARGRGGVAQDLAKRPSPQGGAGAGGGGESQVNDVGNVDLLKGATEKIQDLLGNSAARLGKDGSKLKGFGGFTSYGTGGQALSGTGQGGGGSADTLAGGLGKQGRGGGRVGTGLGAAGDGSGIIGGKTRVVIRSGGPEEAVVMGAIDASAIEAALLAHRDEFRLCYEREINAENPNLAGRVGTSFVIGAQGRVTQAGVASTTLRNANTERCILNVIRRIDFPMPRGGGIVQVTYPFKFSPAGG